MTSNYKGKPVVITGGFGFIGSNLIRLLNNKDITPYILENADNIGEKWRNVVGLSFNLVDSLPSGECVVVHLAANVDTTAPMSRELWSLNVDYSLDLLEDQRLAYPNARFIYASSGAIYGNEERDFRERIKGLKPTNAYAFTKWQLDNLLKDKPNVYGLRFFNVYGEQEHHKGNMRSIVHRAVHDEGPTFQIFRTSRPDIRDGEQARDFVHVEDVCKVIWHFIETEDDTGGLFNVGTGVATSFNEVAQLAGREIEYIDMPAKMRPQYQFHTKADITKLRAHGYDEPFLTVKEGIERMRA